MTGSRTRVHGQTSPRTDAEAYLRVSVGDALMAFIFGTEGVAIFFKLFDLIDPFSPLLFNLAAMFLLLWSKGHESKDLLRGCCLGYMNEA